MDMNHSFTPRRGVPYINAADEFVGESLIPFCFGAIVSLSFFSALIYFARHQ
jgi:hypothetical protein